MLLADEYWTDDDQTLPIELCPIASREHIVDMTVLANHLAVVMQIAIDLLEEGEADEAARIMKLHLEFAQDETRIH